MGEPTFWMKVREVYRQIIRWCLCTVGRHTAVPDPFTLSIKSFCIWCEKEL